MKTLLATGIIYHFSLVFSSFSKHEENYLKFRKMTSHKFSVKKYLIYGGAKQDSWTGFF